MATDEADAALDHQRNGFSRVLKRAEQDYFPPRLTRQEPSTDMKHRTLLVRRISTHMSAHAHASVHMFVCACVERVAAVARRQHSFLFPLFGISRNPRDGNLCMMEDLCVYSEVNPIVGFNMMGKKKNLTLA